MDVHIRAVLPPFLASHFKFNKAGHQLNPRMEVIPGDCNQNSANLTLTLIRNMCHNVSVFKVRVPVWVTASRTIMAGKRQMRVQVVGGIRKHGIGLVTNLSLVPSRCFVFHNAFYLHLLLCFSPLCVQRKARPLWPLVLHIQPRRRNVGRVDLNALFIWRRRILFVLIDSSVLQSKFLSRELYCLLKNNYINVIAWNNWGNNIIALNCLMFTSNYYIKPTKK